MDKENISKIEETLKLRISQTIWASDSVRASLENGTKLDDKYFELNG